MLSTDRCGSIFCRVVQEKILGGSASAMYTGVKGIAGWSEWEGDPPLTRYPSMPYPTLHLQTDRARSVGSHRRGLHLQATLSLSLCRIWGHCALAPLDNPLHACQVTGGNGHCGIEAAPHDRRVTRSS